MSEFFFGSIFIDYSKSAKDWFYGFLFVRLMLLIFLVISIFITGGRTAVLGVAGIFGLGFILQLFNSPKTLLRKMAIPLVFGLLLIMVLPQIKPEYFAAYEKRSSGNYGQTNTEEIFGRVLGSFTGGTEMIFDSSFYDMLFGNGIGVMSNGSEKLSEYASTVKTSWTETDFATSAWEGGIYLVILWYGFRISLILFCFKLWWSLGSIKESNAIVFLLAFVIIIGLTGTLSLQPPLAIWWYLAIGMIVLISYRFNSSKK